MESDRDINAAGYAVAWSSHNWFLEGGRKLHIIHEGASLCGIVERDDHLFWNSGAIDDPMAWLRQDIDGELCATCKKQLKKVSKPNRDSHPSNIEQSKR